MRSPAFSVLLCVGVLACSAGSSSNVPVGAGGAGGATGVAGTTGAAGNAGASGTTGAAGTGIGPNPDAAAPTGAAGAGGGAPSLATGPGVLMRSYDLKRTGANVSEGTLTPANVGAGTFGKLACHTVDGEIYGQILFLPGFDFGPKGRHDALVVATMRNRIYVLDADDPSIVMWTKSYGTPAGPASTLATEGGVSTCRPYNDISQWVGILSTPTVDPQTGTLYFVARSNEGGQQVQKLYAQSLVDGADRPGSPVTIAATYEGAGDQTSRFKDVVTNGRFPFVSKRQNQRMALTLAGGVVYIGWSAFCDLGAFHGWLIGYDAKTLQQAVVFNTTPSGASGGIWMSGSGPAVDDDGSLYLATGNGTADLQGGANHGESLLKLRRAGATMEVTDWFVPFEYDWLEYNDRDLGSAGVLLVPGTNLLMAGGKDSKIYVADRTNLGKFTPPTRPYRKPGAGSAEVLPLGTNAVVQTLAVASMATPPRAHNHSTPVYWKSDAGEFVYTMAEEDFLQQWRLVNGRFELYKSSQVRAPDVPMAPNDYTMPGGTMALSADGAKAASGIVWVTMPVSKDANNAVVPGAMYAFSAADVSKTLWSSQDDAARDAVGNYAKFNPVTVYDGRVYVPTFKSPEAANQFCVYGLR
jgi:hypothetical protein